MNYKGYCLWAPDIPVSGVPHYVIVSSGKDEDNRYLIVAISSIKYNQKGEARFYDASCVLGVNDIKDEYGKNVLTRPSFIRYQYSCILSEKELLNKQISGGYSCKCKISDELLKRIQEGAKVSKELPEYYKKFFDYF